MRTLYALQVYGGDYGGENRGQFHHRVEVPAAMFDGCVELRQFSMHLLDPGFPPAARQCDLLIVHSLSSPEIETLIRARKRDGLPTLFEIADDFTGVGDWLPARHALRNPLTRQAILYHARLCDGLQVSSAGLMERFSTVNPRVFIAPNHVSLPPEQLPKSPPFVFGWAGTGSHKEDLIEIAPAVIGFCRARPEAVFAFMGDLAFGRGLFSEIPDRQKHFRSFGSYEEYLEFLKTLHVGLAPLRDTPFNRGRTDVKFVEFTAAGAASVLADHEVYRPHAPRAFLFADLVGLDAALNRLYLDPHLRSEMADLARRWVLAERGLDVLRKDRTAFYRSLGPYPPALPIVEYFGVDNSGLRELLTAGWKAFEQKQFEEALGIALDLSARRPDYEQASWLAVKSLYKLDRFEEAREIAVRISDDGMYGDLGSEAACLCARRIGRPDERGCLSNIRSPLIRFRLQSDPAESPEGRLRRILDINPYDYLALLGLIRLLQRGDSDSDEISSLRERAALVVPEMPEGEGRAEFRRLERARGGRKIQNSGGGGSKRVSSPFGRFHYSLYGLRLGSNYRLPAPPATPDGPADVEIRVDPEPLQPEPVDGELLWSGGRESLWCLPGGVWRIRFVDSEKNVVWDFLIDGEGSRVTFKSTAEAPEGSLARMILGSVMGTVLMKKKVLALHASAVLLHGGAVLLVGASGSGKSTLAAALTTLGGCLLSDDVSALRWENDVVRVAPGCLDIRLRPDSAEALGFDIETMPLSLDVEGEAAPKRLLATKSPLRPTHLESAPISAVYFLEPSGSAGLPPVMEQMSVREVLPALMRSVYAGHRMDAGVRKTAFARCAGLAGVCVVKRIKRTSDMTGLRELARTVYEDASMRPCGDLDGKREP